MFSQFNKFFVISFITGLLAFNNASSQPIAMCIVNLCSKKPCYFEINWIEKNPQANIYTTRYRTVLTSQEKVQVLQTQQEVGDEGNIIHLSLDLPFDQDKWPRLTFVKNGSITQTEVISH